MRASSLLVAVVVISTASVRAQTEGDDPLVSDEEDAIVEDTVDGIVEDGDGIVEDDEDAIIDDEDAVISDDDAVVEDSEIAEPAPVESAPAEPTATDFAPAEAAPVVDDQAPPSTTSDDTGAADATSTDGSTSANVDASLEVNLDDAIKDLAAVWRVGDATPLSRRSPLPRQFTVEVDMHYGLVGTGPTRFTNDIRVGLFDWWELRTMLTPYPAALMSRFMLGSQTGLLGAFLLEGGLSAWDAGLRLVTDETEPEVGVRFHFEAAVGYSRAIGDRLSVWSEARVRHRLSMLNDDEQTAIAGAVQLTYDLIDDLSITGGLGYAEVIGTPVRELSVNFTETDRPGMAHFLLRNDGWSRSVTIPMAVTYGRIDSFDVDVFVTPRVYPQFDILFGAGIRWRINPVDVVTGWLG